MAMSRWTKEEKLYSPNRQAKMPEKVILCSSTTNCFLLLSLITAILPVAISCSNSGRNDTLVFQLTSNSMAPAIWGPTRTAICPNCKIETKYAAETCSNFRPPLCPSCNETTQLGAHQGPGESIRASSVSLSYSIRRFDCCVFAENVFSNSPQWTCKRVWGLPGELISLKDGELFVDERQYKKSYDELRRLAIPVCSFPQQHQVSWLVLENGRGMRRLDRIRGSLQPGENLVYAPLSEANRDSPAVMDDYRCDQATPRNLKPVDDLLFDFEFEHEVAESLAIEIVMRYKAREFHYTLELTDRGDIAEASSQRERFKLTCAAWDGQDPLVFYWASSVSPAASSTEARNDPLSKNGILASRVKNIDPSPTGLQLSVSRLTQIGSIDVSRDILLRTSERDPSNGATEPVKVPDGEYYLLGDNLPISIDSRNGLGCVSREKILALVPNR